MGLSTFERDLVVALQRAPRAPFATLAAGLSADERTVRRAMRRLQEDGVLTYSATVSYEKTHGWLAAQLEIGCRPGMSNAVAQALADRSETRYVAVTTGDADIVAELVTSDPGALHDLVADELEGLNGVRWVRTQVAMRLLLSAADWDPDGRRTIARQQAIDGVRKYAGAELDESDTAIVGALDDDVRMSAARIAQRVGLHETTVQRRLRRLTESGTIHVRADVPPAELGFPVEARFTLQVSPNGLDAALRRLAAEPALRALYVVTGPSSVLGYSVHPSMAALEDLIDGPFAQIEGLAGCDIRVVLRAYKRNGTRVRAAGKSPPS